MYRVTLLCKGLSTEQGQEAAEDIAQEFKEHRDWHSNPQCSWDGNVLKLVTENNFDNNGQATLDEFGDCLAAYVTDYYNCNISIESIDEI